MPKGLKPFTLACGGPVVKFANVSLVLNHDGAQTLARAVDGRHQP
jgi:hypothetical protein